MERKTECYTIKAVPGIHTNVQKGGEKKAIKKKRMVFSIPKFKGDGISPREYLLVSAYVDSRKNVQQK